jgi:hypothetical protein
MAAKINLHSAYMPSTSSMSTSSKALSEPSKSPISPLQPIHRIDSTINGAETSDNGGIFLFETERQLVFAKKYAWTLYSMSILGCWICTVPSTIVAMLARVAAEKNQVTRAKILFNIAFIFAFFGLILFAVQAGYLAWLARYLLHRFFTQ